MSKAKFYRIFVGDFETTVYEGQESTEVWAAASVELNTEDVIIFHSIEEQFNYFTSLKSNIIVYYHNLKFDGAFWLDFLVVKKKFKPAIIRNSEKEYDVSLVNIQKVLKENKKLKDELKELINKNQHYTENNNMCSATIRHKSRKLFPSTKNLNTINAYEDKIAQYKHNYNSPEDEK